MGMRRKEPKSLASKISIISSIIITVVVGIVVGNLFFSGEQDLSVSTTDNQIKIEGMYGVDIDYSDVKSISLIDKSMNEIEPDAQRDNGYGGFGDTLKGYFSSNDLGNFMLFVKANSYPTIRIQRYSDQDIYMSLSDSEKTKELYQQLIEAVPQS